MSIQYKSVTELKIMLDNNEISNAELIKETLSLIKSNAGLNAFITLNEEESIKKANKLDNSPSSGSLAGIPIAQKDLFCTKTFTSHLIDPCAIFPSHISRKVTICRMALK